VATVTVRARGVAATDDVWERYAQPHRWSQWSPQIRTVLASKSRIGVGVTGEVRPWIGPSIPFVVTAVDEAARTWSWRVRLGPIELRLDHAVTATPDGTLTELTIRGPVILVVPYSPIARVALRRLVR
jgi:hypothetical protein